MKNRKIVDDKFTTLENDIDKLQKSPTLYISYRGPAGSEQLAHEMVNNMVDEHRNKNTLSDGTMNIFLDGETGICYFKDTGRGINFDDLEKACTILQSGTKMDREFGGASGGEYGVGLTATNALSEEFEITSTREGSSRFLRFVNGKKVVDRIVSTDKKIHGLSVGFKPSKAFLGEDAYVPIDSFSTWLQHLVFTLEKEIKITFIATDHDGKEIFNKTYQNVDGNIGGFIPAVVGEDVGYILQTPTVLKNEMTVTETNIPVKSEDKDGNVSIDFAEKERFISIEFAFNYAPSITEPLVYGFTNMIEQIEGGVHVNALKSTISNLLHDKVLASMRKSDTLEVLPEDTLTGLVAVVNLNTTMSTGFESQTKHKLGNRKFIAPLKQMMTQSLTEFFDTTEGKAELKKLIEFAKLNAKIRTDAVNKRKKVRTSLPSLMDSKLIGNYSAANNIGVPKNQLQVALELYIGEGNSAGGQLRKARYNPDYQGVLNFTGKPDNYYSKHLISHTNKFSEGCVYNVLFDKILGCGYGARYNEDNLLYDKIIYAFDADVDGEHMAGLTLSTTWAYAPDLIRNGHVFRVVIPLYKIAESQAMANKMKKENVNPDDYLYEKTELFDRVEERASKYVRIKFEKNGDYISNSNMKRFLEVNRDYYQLLDQLSSFYSVPKDILEYIAANPDYQETIGQLDPELKYKNGVIFGCYKGNFTAVNLDSILMESIGYLTNTIQVGNDGYWQYEFYDRKNDGANFNYVGRKTIGQIMELCQKYIPYIVNRYKGLGEMNKYEMYKLLMNPNHRRLAQYTVSDVERFDETLAELFAKNEKYRKVRKGLVQHSHLSIDDIDN